jgi:hypothetical protein
VRRDQRRVTADRSMPSRGPLLSSAAIGSGSPTNTSWTPSAASSRKAEHGEREARDAAIDHAPRPLTRMRIQSG